MAYCQNCGEEIGANAAFCQGCGAEIDTENTNESTETMETDTSSSPDTETEDGILWGHAGAALLFALIPAFGAYISVSVAAYDTMGIVFLLGLPVFGYLLHQRPTKKAMAGGMCFWLAIEAFLTPFMLLIYTFVFASQETGTGAEQAGAAIGGFILVVVAFVVGLPVGIVLYLLSRRLDVNEDQESGQAVNTQAAD